MKNNLQISSTRQKKDGQLLDVGATLSPIRDRSGAIIGMTGICRDVSARKQAKEELKVKTFLLESFIENNVDAIVITIKKDLFKESIKYLKKFLGGLRKKSWELN